MCTIPSLQETIHWTIRWQIWRSYRWNDPLTDLAVTWLCLSQKIKIVARVCHAHFSSILASVTHAHKNFKFLSLTFSCYQESVVTSQQWLQIRLSSLLIFLRNKCVYCSCSYFPTQTIMSHSRLREVLLPLFLAGFFRVAHEYICGRGTSLSAVTL